MRKLLKNAKKEEGKKRKKERNIKPTCIFLWQRRQAEKNSPWSQSAQRNLEVRNANKN
jgi:hypothetical protein